MSYRVNVFAKYANKPWGADITKVTFDSDEVLIHKVSDEALSALQQKRMYGWRDYTEKPLVMKLSLMPTLDLNRR
jgi:hypothetical protein